LVVFLQFYRNYMSQQPSLSLGWTFRFISCSWRFFRSWAPHSRTTTTQCSPTVTFIIHCNLRNSYWRPDSGRQSITVAVIIFRLPRRSTTTIRSSL
jgi:hypothetical protein